MHLNSHHMNELTTHPEAAMQTIRVFNALINNLSQFKKIYGYK